MGIGPNDVNKLINKVTESLKFRKQGSSGTHDESSRSHVFLEMELVTNKLISERINLWNAEGKLVPVGKAIDDMRMALVVKQKLEELQKKFVILQDNVEKCEQMIENVMKTSAKCIGGTIVFIDLAGNEWGSDSKSIKNDNNVQQRERKEINKSLLSLKGCVRALHSHKSHVPYRDSKLTMVLRPHLKAVNSTAIMIANISPSNKHIQKTYNTLLYSQLIAKA